MKDSNEQTDEESPASEGKPPLGERLKRARLEQDLTLENVAAELRIDASVLESLERGSFIALGAPVFVRGYLKQYGRALGLNGTELLEAYDTEVDAQEVVVQPRRTIQLRDEAQITVWIVAGLVLLLLAVIVFVWWVSEPEVPVAATTIELESPAPIEQAITDPVNSPPVDRSAVTAGGADAIPIVDAASEGDLVTAVETVAVEVNGSSSPRDEVLSTADVEQAAQPQPPSIDEPTTPADPTLLALAIVFVADSWAEVTDARDQRIYYDLGRQGTRTTVYGEPPFSVFLGNADGVQLTLVDEPITVPASGRRGNLANFVVSAPGN